MFVIQPTKNGAATANGMSQITAHIAATRTAAALQHALAANATKTEIGGAIVEYGTHLTIASIARILTAQARAQIMPVTQQTTNGAATAHGQLMIIAKNAETRMLTAMRNVKLGIATYPAINGAATAYGQYRIIATIALWKTVNALQHARMGIVTLIMSYGATTAHGQTSLTANIAKRRIQIACQIA